MWGGGVFLQCGLRSAGTVDCHPIPPPPSLEAYLGFGLGAGGGGGGGVARYPPYVTQFI